jgi:hypothetical protein
MDWGLTYCNIPVPSCGAFQNSPSINNKWALKIDLRWVADLFVSPWLTPGLERCFKFCQKSLGESRRGDLQKESHPTLFFPSRLQTSLKRVTIATEIVWSRPLPFSCIGRGFLNGWRRARQRRTDGMRSRPGSGWGTWRRAWHRCTQITGSRGALEKLRGNVTFLFYNNFCVKKMKNEKKWKNGKKKDFFFKRLFYSNK